MNPTNERTKREKKRQNDGREPVSADSSPLVCIEGLPQKRFVEALLQPYPVEIVEAGTSSGAVSNAVYFLLHTDRPVAVLVESRTENEREIASDRGSIKRILARANPEGWFVAMAIPRLDAWALTDPRIKRDFDSRPDAKPNYYDRMARIAELTKDQPFDATELYRTVPDFRGLVDFLRQHSQAAASSDQR